jgi:hypothetical protein
MFQLVALMLESRERHQVVLCPAAMLVNFSCCFGSFWRAIMAWSLPYALVRSMSWKMQSDVQVLLCTSVYSSREWHANCIVGLNVRHLILQIIMNVQEGCTAGEDCTCKETVSCQCEDEIWFVIEWKKCSQWIASRNCHLQTILMRWVLTVTRSRHNSAECFIALLSMAAVLWKVRVCHEIWCWGQP